ncbi:MAG: tetratricopeptide repeat protein [Deltaproteobacteria bacterium]|nr:tetratricopeptide repeat protein [Deltaproteobacteria bacterium]
MDERLEAGRHHLVNGERALHLGYPDDARAHFEAALLQFRGPELRLGEAHALRGLGQLELALGNLSDAEARLHRAVDVYDELLRQLAEIDPDGVSVDMKRRAQEGEIASLVLLGELKMRAGQPILARDILSSAGRHAEVVGNWALRADVLTTQGRVALRTGEYDEAERGFRDAIAAHQTSANVEGEIGAWLLLAELERLRGNLGRSRIALERARPLAEATSDDRLLGRVHHSLGALEAMALNPGDARGHFEVALTLVRRTGDAEMEGYTLLGLGEVASRVGEGSALENLVDGARILGALGHRHGVASALVRIGEHGIGIGEPELALAASEAARRLWEPIEPVRGVGQALRFITKALLAMDHPRAALLVAVTREGVVGAVQPNARQVADYFRDRAPPEWVRALEGQSKDQLIDRTREVMERILRPILWAVNLEAEALGTVSGALAAVETLGAKLPSPAPPAEEEEPSPGEIPPELPPLEEVEAPGPLPSLDEVPEEEGHVGAFPALGMLHDDARRPGDAVPSRDGPTKPDDLHAEERDAGEETEE